jgi:excinuclease UvrABC nuclease subunit
MIPPPALLDPKHPELPAHIAGIPNSRGVYLLMPDNGIPYLGSSIYISKRLSRLLLHTTDTSNSLSNIRAGLSHVRYWLTGSRLETSLLLYWLALEHYPETYRKRLKLKDPWVLTLLEDEFPRLVIRNRLIAKHIAAFGPFPSRDAADRVVQGVLGLFQIRRCEERLYPSEQHPGCIYGEMNLCLRPCQLAVSSAEYAAEVARITEFLESNGKHTLSVLTAARDRASEQTDFEEAARLHKELERVKGIAALRDELITDIESLNGVALTTGSRAGQVTLWPMLAGYWQLPVFLDFTETIEARSLDQYVQEQLAQRLAEPRNHGNRAEEVSLLSRWYYSSWRDGQWFSFRVLEDLNLRKLVREISRLVRDTGPNAM